MLFETINVTRNDYLQFFELLTFLLILKIKTRVLFLFDYFMHAQLFSYPIRKS